MTQVVTLTKQGTVGVVALDNPPVNALSHAVRVQLRQLLAGAYLDAGIEALVIACEGRTFVAGADIREFGAPPREPDLPEVVEFIDESPVPVVAAIHGSALGGGLELALACHYRVAAANSRVGLPEVTLGILPGAGGTQRLPRLVGVRAALDLIVSGAPISAREAHALGLLDEIVDGDPRSVAVAFAERLVAERRPLRKVSQLPVALDDPQLFTEYAKRITKQSRGPRAPFVCIEAIQAAAELPFRDGLARERKLFVELMNSTESKAQRHAFFGEREVAKVKDLPDTTKTRDITAAVVVGGGATAAGIALCFAEARLPVTWIATSEAELSAGLVDVRGHYANAVANGALEQADADQRLARIRSTLAYEDLRAAELVIVASSGNTSRLTSFFAELGAVGKPGVIVATGTPYLGVDQLAEASKRPEDAVGLHFAGPLGVMRLLEIARGRATAPEVCATALKLAKTLGRVPVLVRAASGLVGARIFARAVREASCLLEEGALPAQLQRVFADFGFAAGPFSADERTWFDVVSSPAHIERLALGEGLLAESSAALGKDSSRDAAPAMDTFLRKSSDERGISRRVLPDQEVLERCVFAMINEGARLLEEGVVTRPLEVDMICIHGYGFPVHRGGPLFYADQVGLSRVYETMRGYRERSGAETWACAPLLERLATQHSGFYAAS